jgi:hypothetical protein
MRKVWNELQKRKRESYQPTVYFVHPATPTASWFAEDRYPLEHSEWAEQREKPPAELLRAYWAVVLSAQYRGAGPELSQQDLALAYFFDKAFTQGQKNIRLIRLSELRKNRSHYCSMAKRLRADAAEQERLGLYDPRKIVGKLKLVKRQMYGRAKLDLLRARLMEQKRSVIRHQPDQREPFPRSSAAAVDTKSLPLSLPATSSFVVIHLPAQRNGC